MSKVDLRKYKSQIDAVLQNFNESISRDTTPFWHFLDRFQHIEASQQKAAHGDRRKSEHHSSLSSKHNFELNLKDTGLSTKVLERFCCVFSHYFAFAQASKFKALQKIDDDRRTLPIYTSKYQIRDALQRNDVLIVAGDTGCGKSTQVAQYLVEFGYQRIAVTQPRRIACISLANRVAFERNSAADVGYQIRFDKQSNSRSRITFMTEGVLLRQLSADALLSQYDVLVIDEVHERHVFTDFLLGVVRCLLQARRGSVKVVLMSATINLELFEAYFRRFDAPIVTVSGRLYPIRVEYHPVSGAAQPPPHSGGLRAVQRSKFDPTPYVRILQLIDTRYSASDRGDVLVFLSGISEIRAVFAAVRTYADSARDPPSCAGTSTTTATNAAKWIVLALHSSLAAREQDRVFALAPEGYRRCILATNIAETSVTIDRIRFVIDSGRVRELCYDPHTRMERLEEFWISRASAEQRKGRAGRTGPGVCFRLYSEADYTAFQAYSPAEIHRVSLDSLVLQMVVLGLTNPQRFPFIEPVESANLERSLRFLEGQQAIRKLPAIAETADEQESKSASTGSAKGACKVEPTSIGRMLANLPVDVPIGKMLILAAVLGERETAVTLCCAALLSAQSIFSNRLLPSSRSRDDDEPLNDAAIARLRSECGDLLTAARHLAAWLRVKSGREARDSRKWARRHGVEEQRLYEVVKLRRQFARILADSSLLDRLRQSDSSSESESDSEYEADRSGKRRRDERLSNNERARLHAAKRQNLLGLSKRRKRRTLQMRGDEPATDSESDSGADVDVNDLEMRSRRNELDALVRVADQLDDLDTLGTSHTHSRDLTVETNAIVTFVLCYGLHAQMAVGDEFNAARSAFTELVFHTSTKQFVSLHPSTCFMYDPELLKRTCADGSRSAQSDATKKTKRNFSTKCELILHGTLLETSKAYLINVLRVPALQTLLLFTRLDTNRDCSRIVCDGWLELTFAKADEAERALRKAVSIRDKLDRLLDAVLRRPDENEDDEKESESERESDRRARRSAKKSRKRARRRMREEAASLRDNVAHLRSEIVSFYRLRASHTLRRVLPSELSHLYRAGKSSSGTEASSSQQPYRDLIATLGLGGEAASDVNAGLSLTEEQKGGQQVRSYLTLNCLVDDDEAAVWNEYTLCMQRHFQCPKCGQQFIMDVADRLRHESECNAANQSLTPAARPTDVQSGRDDSSSSDRHKNEQAGASMPCSDCGTICSSLGDLIRHRRTCKPLS